MTQLILDLDNQKLTDRLKKLSIHQKKTVEDLAIEAIKNFVDASKKQDEPAYIKKNVTDYMQLIQKDFDEGLCDEKALTHIKDSASYIHNLRRQNAAS